MQLQNLTTPAVLAHVIEQGNPDKLFLAAMDFIDGHRELEPETRMCWLYLFTDHHRGRGFCVSTLARKICCPVAVTLQHLASLERSGLVRFEHPVGIIQ